MTPPDEDGSVILLTLGYALLAIALILVSVCATDLYIAQKRLDALADAAALAGADGFTVVVEGNAVRADLTDDAVRTEAEALLRQLPGDAVLVSAESPDGSSARVRLSADWHPPLVSLFVPEGVRLDATGTSRTALH
ncbi:hypothetical protein [Microbacterium hydrocarbonoxydans]|uniref:Flp pilus-assembly TadE/G-like n=1 Tax=Microbacterium hydrocarbonoxydans TaxID=273678 RepID=A0A1H4KHP9_9MICO|nr:hypothetical protein [Microbacterium hydrocarbonoxydans]SEB58084.1 hypothetical protein SAMN04489807_1427 [Microbacterium hydrocarbonoxydans]